MDKTMDDKLIYITNDDKQDYPFCRLRSMVETWGQTNENSVKVPKVSELANRIT